MHGVMLGLSIVMMVIILSLMTMVLVITIATVAVLVHLLVLKMIIAFIAFAAIKTKMMLMAMVVEMIDTIVQPSMIPVMPVCLVELVTIMCTIQFLGALLLGSLLHLFLLELIEYSTTQSEFWHCSKNIQVRCDHAEESYSFTYTFVDASLAS